jgi:hypothetical protein
MAPSLAQKLRRIRRPLWRRTIWIIFYRVGALRKYAGGIFLASDLGGYAAVASVLIFAALSGERIATPVCTPRVLASRCGLARNDRLFDRLKEPSGIARWLF